MSQEVAPHAPAGSRATLVVSIVLMLAFAVAGVLSLRADNPPAPRGADAPADTFSAHRARAVLTRVLGDEAPHPTGSPANAAVRDRIRAEFERIGLPSEVHRRF